MDEIPNFPKSNENLKIKEEKDNEEEESSENINDEEEEEDDDKKDKNSENDDDSLSLDIDEDRYTLVQIREFLKKKRLKTEKRSLINKKPANTQNITFDSNTRSIRGCFVPDQQQLNEFLNNCVVKEIFEDDSTLSIKEEKQNVFDPQEFMLSNGITKSSLSVEDLSFVKKKNSEEKLPELSIVEEKPVQGLKKPKMTEAEFIATSIYKSKDKEKLKEQFNKIRKIMSTDVLSLEQKKWLSDFIKNISALPLKEIIINNKKFDIVFDLDNTCMFSYLCNGEKEIKYIKTKFSNKNIKSMFFQYNNNLMYSILIIRKGLKEFIENIKDLANFHISTLASKNYAEKISEMIEEICDIKFQKFSSRSDVTKNRKYISDLNEQKNLLFPEISESNTIIFDDSVNVWQNESFNVIASKKFFDRHLKINNNTGGSFLKISDLDNFLNSYSPYSYNKLKDGVKPSWKNQVIVSKPTCPFYIYKSKDQPDYNESLFAEYEDSPKYQFIYMINVIKVLYCLVFHNDLEISNAIKLVRLNALNGKCFNLKYLNSEQKSILKDIIIVCGGDIYEPSIGNEESILDLTKKIFLVVPKREYHYFKDEIKLELKKHPNFIMIDEKFILDSYYFMTDLEDRYKDKEYTDFDDNK